MRSALSFTRSLLPLLTLCANAWCVEYGLHDPAFERVPFGEWMAGGAQSHIHWSVELLPPELTAHQRMLSRMALTLDGRELEKRRGSGEFTAFIQYEDSAGHLWQNHTTFDLDALPTAMQHRNLVIGHYAFLVPGDYSVSLAIWHPASGEHRTIRRHVHVNALVKDPLPDAWEGLPAVEFFRPGDVPDYWFLPDVHGTLNLPVQSTRPVQVDLLVNTTPSEAASGSVGALRRNMNLLIPAMRVLSGMHLRQGAVNVALLDLTHRKVAFEQKDVRDVDWDRMRRYFTDQTPGVVDVNTLANEWRMRQYFWEEVSRRMKIQDGAAHVVVVLSAAAFLSSQQEAVEPEWEPADADHRLIYIRYRYDPLQYFAQRRMRPGARPRPMPAINRGMAVDDLEKTLQALHPRLLDAISAEQFRRIVAAVIEEISHY